MKVEIRARLNPTEGEEKVLSALRNIFPDAPFYLAGDEFQASGGEGLLDNFSLLLQKQKIRDAANVHLRLKTHHDHLRFFLNKQAAFVGKVNFCSDCAMGPIVVTVEGEGIEMLADRISPGTKEEKDEDRD